MPALVMGSKGAYPYHEGKHLIVALRQFVYVDESGIHDGAAYCVVAGFRGSPNQWASFNREWRSILTAYGVEEFHSKIFFNRKVVGRRNPYTEWSDEKVETFFDALLRATTKRALQPVGVAVEIAAFNSYSFGERCLLAGYQPTPTNRMLPAPYHLAFRMLLGQALEGTHSDIEVHFRVAEQEAFQQRAHEAFWLTKQYGTDGREKRLRSIEFLSPSDAPALQAADLFVHQWYNTLSRGSARLNKENTNAMNVLTLRNPAMAICDVPSIERIFADVGVTDEHRRIIRGIAEPQR